MNKRVQIFAGVFLFITLSLAGNQKRPSTAEVAHMIVQTAVKYHYQPRAVDDAFSQAVYRSFFHQLDPYGLFFTREIKSELDTYSKKIDDQIREKKITFLKAATSAYKKQINVVESLLDKSIGSEIDFAVCDTLWFDKNVAYGKQSELKDKWKRWIKYLMLWRIHNTTDSTDTMTMPVEKELDKILEDVISRETCRLALNLGPKGGLERFTGSVYLKAIAQAYDPHTQYLSYAEKKQWDTYISKRTGSFGIRVNFNLIGEIEIVEVVPGGPAWRSNKVNQGDVILDIKIPGGSKIDLRCATLADVHTIISSIGSKKTAFRIRKKSGKVIQVWLKKELLTVEENTIRSYVLKGASAIGYIYLPSFYADFTYGNYFSKGCANDIAKELIKLKRDSVDGLILDIQSNGGGSLEEVYRMAGVFIDHGALGITHSRRTDPKTIKDKARGMIYRGPLVVLVNSSSASASELLAGVLQDYNRALIVGSKTFGKSTIQQALPVDAGKFDSLTKYSGIPPGFLHLTTGTFYRVNGHSHQKIGVIPDLELPRLLENTEDREEFYDEVLEFSNINKKTYYYPVDPLPVARLRSLCEKRIKGNSVFRYIKAKAKEVPNIHSRYPVPLAFKSFSQYINTFDEVEDSVKVSKPRFTPVLLGYNKRKGSMTDQEIEDNKTYMRSIEEDVYINEAYTIINDLIASITIKKQEGK